MKKATNKFRRCPNCPHHQVEQKCCCLRRSVSKKTRPMTSRPKKQPSTIDQSSVVNTTLPTLIAQFSALRTQNNHLKRELLNVSAFVKDENCSLSANTDSSLSEKLFLANKNLKEALIEIDSLSKANKQLCERNSNFRQQNQGLKIQIREIQNYLERYRKKYKRVIKDKQIGSSREDFQTLINQNQQFQEEIISLKEKIRCLQFENKNLNMIGTLSPQWVAQTGIKYKAQDVLTKFQDDTSLPQQNIEVWKKNLSETISLLRNEGSHFSSLSQQGSEFNLNSLIQQLLSSYSESIMTHFHILIKQISRKLNNYEKKVNNLACKLHNFLMVFKNSKLKKHIYPQTSGIKTYQRTPMSSLTHRLL